MKVLVALEHHFGRGPDGEIYTAGAPHYSFWERYLQVFEEVGVVARVGPRPELEKSGRRASGPGVTFFPLPDYYGPWEYLRSLGELKARIREAVLASDACILRVWGQVGTLCWRTLQRLGRPYALEVVSDPWDVFAPGNVPGLFRPFFRRLGRQTLAALCREAMAAAYVTREALQGRYPPGRATFATYYSDADLTGAFSTEENLRERMGRIEELKPEGGSTRRPLRVGFVGNLAQPYKGVDTLLEAARLCLQQGTRLEVTIVGEGRFRLVLEALARKLGMECQVRFLGQLLAGTDVYNFLDGVDLFVLPSRVEGLPRALLEAMARGCPCLGTSVGGVGELLPEAERVQPGDGRALARAMAELARDPKRLGEMARRNRDKAQEYSPEILAERRRLFYSYVRSHSQKRG
ncbi:MAG: glycosyltransferase family 4 protein [Candidatus Acidiferrales bacterium]